MITFTQRHEHLIVLIFIFIGILLKIFHFPDIPPGLHRDEISAAYESYSLITEGTDRWGNRWPVYFPSWGSGQSVLLSYLQIPFISLFGITAMSIRIVPLILGIITPLLFYISVKKAFNRTVALIALLLLIALPWHVMQSRWALDAHLLPFFLLLGVFTLQFALENHRLKKLIVPLSLLPFAMAFYSYGLGTLVIIPFLFLFFKIYLDRIRKDTYRWGLSVLIFLIMALPWFLFLLKAAGVSIPFETLIPFSLPELPGNRVDQIKLPFTQTMFHNVIFLIQGFADPYLWNTIPGFPPLSPFWPLSILGIAISLRKNRKNLYVLWLIACIPLFLLPLNGNRGNAFFFPFTAFLAYGIQVLLTNKSLPFSRFVHRLILGGLLIFSVLFYVTYFTSYSKLAGPAFHEGIPAAIRATEQFAGQNVPIYVSSSLPLNYIYVLTTHRVLPSQFRQNAAYTDSHGEYIVERYDRYFFSEKAMTRMHPTAIVFLIPSSERTPAICQHTEISANHYSSNWTIGKCKYTNTVDK